MQFNQTNHRNIISKILIVLTVIPVAVLLISIVIPLLLIAVTFFWCFMYFYRKKYENATYYKYINKKFSSCKYPSETVIDAQYKSLNDEKPN